MENLPWDVVRYAGVAFASGYVFRILWTQGRIGTVEERMREHQHSAREKAERTIEKGELRADRIREKAEIRSKEMEDALIEREGRFMKREEMLDKRQGGLDKEEASLRERQEKVSVIEVGLRDQYQEVQEKLSHIANLSPAEAKQELINRIRVEQEEDLSVQLNKIDMIGREKLEARAKNILATAIHRFGNSVNPNVMTTFVSLPSDDYKGKIIGKEGRNIKAFEQVTGTELVIDETPGTISISCFDPVRRYVAQVALENLILDGRIQPVRIEELVAKAQQEVNDTIKQKGEEAVRECGIFNLDPRLVAVLGRLYFRTSYGQNVLQHSLEVAHIAGMLAKEIGANEQTAKIGGLLHDIGKAVDHEIAGSHVDIGRRILQKFGVHEDVIKAMQSHHEEYPYETPESLLVQTADHISGIRPGARHQNVEDYFDRMVELETIATNFPGVEKTYALQAGREVRIFVTSEEIDDVAARDLAREVALKIENELSYPGEIRINVIRETRVTTFAR